jgi:hypothetical protein
VEVPRLILTPPVLPPAADASNVSFANPAVLRVAFGAAALSILLDSIPFVGFLFIIWSMGAGFMAVWMYRKRTGKPLSVGSGAKLGWITGVFTFLILTVMLTAGVVLSGGKWTEDYRQTLTAMGAHDPNYQQVLRAFENPATFATVIFFALFLFFVLLSLASVAGGALGARFSNKD